MRELLLQMVSGLLVWLVRAFLLLAPDALIRSIARLVRRFQKGTARQACDEIVEIFSSRRSSQMARQIVRRARPQQLRDFVRGALR